MKTALQAYLSRLRMFSRKAGVEVFEPA